MSAHSDILFPHEVDSLSLTFPDFPTLSDFEDFSNDILLVTELDGLSNEALLEDFNRINPLLMDDFTITLEGIKEEAEDEGMPFASTEKAVPNKSLLSNASEGPVISPRTMAATSKLNCMSLNENLPLPKSKICNGPPASMTEQSGSPRKSLPSLVYGNIPLVPSFPQDEKHIQTNDVDGMNPSQVMESFFPGSQVPGMKVLKNSAIPSGAAELPSSSPLRQCTSNGTQIMIGGIKHADARPTITPSIFHINSPLSSPSASVSNSVESSLFQLWRQEENFNLAKKPAARSDLQQPSADRSSFTPPAVDIFHGAMHKKFPTFSNVSSFPTMQRSQSSDALGQFRSSGRHLMTCPEDFVVSTMEMSSSPGFPSQKPLANYEVSNAEELVERSSIIPMRRVFSTGDIQARNGVQISYGDNNTSRSVSSIEEFTMGMKVGHYTLEERKVRLHRYRQKRNERNFSKKIKYVCRKTLADSRPRVRGRFARTLDDSGEPLTKENGIFLDDECHEVDGLMTSSGHCGLPNGHGVSFWNLAGKNEM